MLRTRPAPVHISFVALLSLQARTVLSMGAAFPCLGGNKPPRAPPPMARPLPPHLNACVPDDLNSANDWRRAFIPNPWLYLGHPKAPPPHLDRARFDYEVPVKAPPPHLRRLPGIAVRRDLPVIKAPPANVFAMREYLLKARAPHVIVVREQPRPTNQAFAVVRGS